MTLTHPFAGWRLGPQHRTTCPLLPFQFTGAIVGTTYSEDSATATIADVVGTRVTVANGYLTLASGGTDGDPAFIGDTGATWAAGLAFIVKGSAAANAGVGLYIADTTTPINIQSTAQGIGWYLLGTDDFVLRNGTQRADTPSPGTNWTLAIIARANGVFALVNGKLWWPFTTDPAYSTVYPHVVSSKTAPTTLDAMLLTSITAPETALVTDSIAGTANDGDTFAHEPDAIIQYTVNPLTGINEDVAFRQQDADNQWLLRINNDGSLQLFERSAPTATVRASASSASVAAGDTVTIVLDGTSITVYVNGAQMFSYTNATSFQTATQGEVGRVVYRNGVTDLVAYRRTVPSSLWTQLTEAIQ